MSTILEICQDAAALVATQKPDDLFDADSQQAAVFLSIAKDTLNSLRRYGDWQELTKEGHLLVTPNKQVYDILDFCPDFYALIPNTVYIRDTTDRVIGSVSPEQWMKERFFNGGSPDLCFKIQNNCVRFLNPPRRRCRIVFYYRSGVIALNKDDQNVCSCCDSFEKTTLTKNTDIPVFDEYLVKLGIIWRWYKRNGLPYEEELNEYEKEVKARFGSGLCPKDIRLSHQLFDLPNGGGIHVVARC